ncbi:unnamed protein product, partial [Cylicostephanus goldi]
MTLAEQKEAIRRLASKNGVLVEMEDYIEASDARLKEMKAEAKRISAKLPKALEEFWKILEDPYRTGVEKYYDLQRVKIHDPA